LELGSRVWFATSAGMAPGDGSLAELVRVAADDLVPISQPVGDEVVAALGLSAVAAWMSLTHKARLRPGERVLVLGGGGAVGQAAIGAARHLGASRIVATCRSKEAAARAEAAGADQVVITGQDLGGLEQQIAGACLGQVEVVVDPVFGATAAAAARVLADGGRLVNLGSASHDEAVFSSAHLRSRSIEILGYTNNSLTPEQRRAAVTEICALAAGGALGVAHEVHPLARIGDVWAVQAKGNPPARFVLEP
ncbi:MAG TPA: zinc-binding dehydrogenase, partial [Propionicimonas sp.]|nr:zinc-binding dehydrogenase [Propionicimonas sp.]